MTVNNPYTWGLGRRKSSVARVRIKPGSGTFQVNKKAVGEYFTTLRDLNTARAPLALMEVPDAYDTLLQDVIGGDPTLFVRNDWVEESWRLFAPVVGADLPVAGYPAGSWGPAAADALLPAETEHWATGDGSESQAR